MKDIWEETKAKYGEGERARRILGLLGIVDEMLKSLAYHGEAFELVRRKPETLPSAEWPKVYRNPEGQLLVVSSEVMANNLTSGWTPNVGEEPQVAKAPPRPPKAETFVLGLDETGKPAITSGGKKK